jgi:modulator of FtsH protease
VTAYSAAAWREFFVAAAGASAALLGLLFVTMSVNLAQILKYRYLPPRAAATLGSLLTILVICCFGLAPGQGRQAFAWEVLAVVALAGLQALWAVVRSRDPEDPGHLVVPTALLLVTPLLVLLGGGISLLACGGGGIYWLLVGTVLVFIAASVNAWVLLVEILR